MSTSKTSPAKAGLLFWLNKLMPILLLAMLSSLMFGLTPTPQAHAALGSGVKQTVLASNPVAYASKTDYRIHQTMTKIVDGVPSGGSITWNAWEGTESGFARALIRACRDRNVDVFVAQKGNASGAPLKAARDECSKPGRGHWKVCRSTDSTGAVINSCMSPKAGMSMHDKSFTASASNWRGALEKYVTAVGSTNMTLHGYETNQMIVTTGDSCPYNAMRAQNADMRALRKNADYNDSVRGRVSCPASDMVLHFTPTDNDIQAEELVRYKPGPGCYVDATMRYFQDRTGIIEQLGRLDKAGCPVVLYSDTIPEFAVKQFAAVGIPVRGTEKTWTLSDGTKRTTRMHDKGGIFNVYVDGKLTKIVWTGSLNQTGNSGQGDETWGIFYNPDTAATYERTAVKYIKDTDYEHRFMP